MDSVWKSDSGIHVHRMQSWKTHGIASNKTVDQPAKKALDTVKVAAVIGKCGKCCYSQSFRFFWGPIF